MQLKTQVAELGETNAILQSELHLLLEEKRSQPGQARRSVEFAAKEDEALSSAARNQGIDDDCLESAGVLNDPAVPEKEEAMDGSSLRGFSRHARKEREANNALNAASALAVAAASLLAFEEEIHSRLEKTPQAISLEALNAQQ